MNKARICCAVGDASAEAAETDFECSVSRDGSRRHVPVALEDR
jgi:hypothetical protein